MNLVSFTIVIWLVYLALTADLSFINLLLGLLAALFVTWLLRQRAHALGLHHLLRKPLDLVIYIYYQVLDLLKTGIQMARIVFDPALPIKPGIIEAKMPFTTEAGMALSAHAITLTPGEVVVEFDVENHSLLIHTLILEDSRANNTEQEKRLQVLERLLS